MPAEFDAVVIGSGFGGAINALRLAEGGAKVLVLERGRRYAPGTFPRDAKQTDKVFWGSERARNRDRGARGLFDVNFFSGISTVTAAGIGGGSLIYANIHIRPDASVFEDPRWPKSFRRASLDPYYDRVAQKFGIAPIPHDLPKRDQFRACAQELGRDVFDPDQAVRWNSASDAPDDGRRECQLCTECEFGCQYGAKNTLDFTYLADAEALGAEVRPHAEVSHIEANEHDHPERVSPRQRYSVHYRDLETDSDHVVEAATVVLAAGTLGTNAILLRSRDEKQTLPHVSKRLGDGFSGNGDFLGSLQNCDTPIEPWRGPDVTSVIRFDDPGTFFTMAAPTFNETVMRVLGSHGQAPMGWLRPFVGWLWRPLNRLLPAAFKWGLLSRPVRIPLPKAGDPSRLTFLFAIGQDNAGGKLSLKKGRLDIDWKFHDENRALVDAMKTAFDQVAQTYGGTAAPLVTWNLFNKIVTVHPLGGCRLSESPTEGVVSERGEVHGHPGLFVADGSVIPTSIGFHPVMTISAVAERISDHVVEHHQHTTQQMKDEELTH